MPALVKMPGRVLARRSIATAYVPAFGATPQVQPPSATCQALDTANFPWFYIGVDTPNVPLLFFHRDRSQWSLAALILRSLWDGLPACHGTATAG
jgi:hypothetical protein